MAEVILLLVLAFVFYTYVGYPALLKLLSLFRRYEPVRPGDREWPPVSITVPAFNEDHQIAETLESLLALDYPEGKKQILIVSDASTDRTDEIVASYAGRGVQLVRQPERRGKTAAENAVAGLLRGEIVVNTDASIRIHPWSLRELVAPFADPGVGLVSSRDVSVGREGAEANQGEAGYVGYEMWIRDLETKVGGIVGASGSLYAVRRELHGLLLPEALSRDFAAALNTRERGMRPISVSSATCVVPRAKSLRREYPRKVRTITRGMETLYHKRALLNPFRYGIYAWMLFSHKVCRWLTPWAGLVGLAALALLSLTETWAGVALAGTLGVIALGSLAWALGADRPLPRVLSLPAFFLMANLAVLASSVQAMKGHKDATWEPTRR
jgi:cellulose synthase/poly-beta-1,6-N-acetylglucosamine synthase-like glycosyltransferase